MSDVQHDDPGDTRFYLVQNGWYSLTIKESDSDFYFNKLTAGDATLGAIIEFTPGGRRRFYVDDPPEAFKKAAHDGSCLTSRGIADGEQVHHLHFSERPDSLADGIRIIESMLEAAQ